MNIAEIIPRLDPFLFYKLVSTLSKNITVYLKKKNLMPESKYQYLGLVLQLYGTLKLTQKLYASLILDGYQYLKKTDWIQNKIAEKSKPMLDEIRSDLNSEVEAFLPRPRLLEEPYTESQILHEFQKMTNIPTFKYKQGHVSGAVYANSDMLESVYPKIYSFFSRSNPLHTNVFPAVRKMENDLVKIMINLYHGDSETVGCFTSGGTESILLACKAYRDRAYEQGIRNPNMIVSSSVHCAFYKAAKYFKLEVICIPSLEDGTFNLTELEAQINSNTVLVVASAPSYNLGIMDPIGLMSDICVEKKVGLHIDGCMGSFIVNFSNEICDFRLPGVTSISSDYHKYGQTPKGASVIMYHCRDLMKYQYFIDGNWSGGVYATTTMAGSKNGNIVALSWATVMMLGKKAYLENYRKIIANTQFLKNEILTIPELEIYGDPKFNIVGIGSQVINTNILGERLNKKGWKLNMIQNPDGFHFCVTSFHTVEVIAEFIQELKDLIPNIPDTKTKSKCIYGTMKTIPDPDIIQDIIGEYLHIVNGF
jgi:sphinganine-1-phosphate aldolase